MRCYARTVGRKKRCERQCRFFFCHDHTYKWWELLIKFGALIAIPITIVSYNNLGYWGGKASSNLEPIHTSAIFQSSDSLNFNVLITRFEDYVTQSDAECIGKSIEQSIGVIDANNESTIPIVSVYTDSILSPSNQILAKAIQEKHNADLIIYGLARNIEDCNSAEVCFRFNVNENFISRENPEFDVPISRHDAKYIVTSPVQIESGNFEINEFSLRKWISLLAELKINKKKISFFDLEKIMIDSDTLSDQELSDIYLNIGRTCKSLKQYECSIEAYSKAINLFADKPEYYNYRGLAYKNSQNFPLAINDYTKALSLNPSYHEAYYNRGAAYERSKNYQAAIEDFKRAIKLHSKDEDYFIYLGFVYDKMKEYQKAVKYYSIAININPEDTLAYGNRGTTYRDLNQKQKAIKDIETALSLDSTYSPSYNSRGIYYKNEKRYNLALKDYNKAISLSKGKHTYAYFNRGYLHFLLKNHSLALKDFDKSIELDPEDSDGYFFRGIAKLNLNNYKSAIEDFSKSLALNDSIYDNYYYRGKSFYELKKYKEAVEDFSRSIQKDTLNLNAYSSRANAYFKMQNQKEALDDFDKAIQLNPELANTYNSRGSAYLKTLNVNYAIADFKKAISLRNTHFYSYFNLFLSYCLKYWYLVIVIITVSIVFIARKFLNR
ncbi:tetratricopeptide repeat protein [Flagellimonas sp.]|uniref:tetratricopeptide repeat protein n=1 Tax=Flagellimonas sp. TaxID=2058762 RepID=UPI003BA9C2F7